MERKITIEEAAVYHEDYQMRILQMNEIEGILPVKGRGMDGASYYDYNVSGKISMQAMYEKNKIGAEDLKSFLQQLLAVIRETENYLLNIHCILMAPEFIFYEDGKFFFCYYPKVEQELWEGIHSMTEYFVKQADYADKECVRMVFILHKETMEENYSLEKVVKECMKEEQEESSEEESCIRVQQLYDEDEDGNKGKNYEYDFGELSRKNPGIPDNSAVMYDNLQQKWLKKQYNGSLLTEETENMWTPVKRLLDRRKKPKWGDWDGLYVEEEEV